MIVEDVCGTMSGRRRRTLSISECDYLEKAMTQMKFLPGGRYIYYAGRPAHYFNNCFMLRAEEDTREEWASLVQRATSCLMVGGGIGVDYSRIRPKGRAIGKTGGIASGSVSLMQMINEIGRHVMQGGSRRCLPEGTQITLPDGSKKSIEDIEVGDLVETRFGARRVVNKFYQDEQPCLEIKTKHGTVRSSFNHKWLSATQARIKTFSVPAGNLSLNNKLYFHPTPQIDGGADYDTERAYLLGYFLGDGCSSTSNRSHEVTLQIEKPKYNKKQVDRLVKSLEEFCGHKPHVRKGHGEVTEVAVSHKESMHIFQGYKKPNSAFVIPEEIYGANFQAKCAFIAGWFDADGYYGTDSWKLANMHQSVRSEVIAFLRTIGFLASENGNEVRLCSYQKPLWRKLVMPYANKRPRGHITEKSTSEIPSKILSIKNIGILRTYDLEIEDVHEFIADDFVSHNSAIYASLNWRHGDVEDFIDIKDWSRTIVEGCDNKSVSDLKRFNFNYAAPLDMTNVSLNYDDAFLSETEDGSLPDIFLHNIRSAMMHGEPGLSFNFGNKANETLRNACCELTSEDDSDVCNLGSINLGAIETIEEFRQIINVASKFLVCGTLRADLPYEKVRLVREKNRRIGLGLMGIHEWLLKRNYRYEMNDELRSWLQVYKDESEKSANEHCDRLYLSRPAGYRAIAPTGTIGLIASTTTGIEPLYAVAYKRRYLVDGTNWKYEFVVDNTAEHLIKEYGLDPSSIETAVDLAKNPERRIAFQADIQDYVDHAISSTINLPSWGSKDNNEGKVLEFATLLRKYAPRLRGFTCYPDGSRGGQPLTTVPYNDAKNKTGVVYSEHDVCDITGKGGSCGS